MQFTVLPNGRVQVQDPSGPIHDIGPEHPEYPRLLAQCIPPAKPDHTPDYTKMRLFGLLLIVVGLAAWWYNWHTAATEGKFSIRLTILGPAGVFGGLLLLLRPDWSGRVHSGSSSAQKVAIGVVFGLIALASGVDFYVLQNGWSLGTPPVKLNKVPPMPPMEPIRSFAPTPSTSSTVLFQRRLFELKSFHARPAATWEFGNPGEPIDKWTTLLTLIDRPDAHTRQDLDRLAEGIQFKRTTKPTADRSCWRRRCRTIPERPITTWWRRSTNRTATN